MLDSSRIFSLVKILAALVIIGWSLSYYGLAKTGYVRVFGQVQGQKARFIDHFLETEVGGPFNGESIAALCANRLWTKGMIFNCNPPSGGIGMVRNAHLNCIRFAMEAGAELILPEIIRRKEDITQVAPDSKGTIRGVPLDYFYDKDHLNRSLSASCPQMKLYSSIDDLYNTPMGNPISLSPAGIGLDRADDTVIQNPEKFAAKFKEYRDSKSNTKVKAWPFLVNVDVTLYAWPTSYDAAAFVRNFGRIIRFREDTRRLAAAAFYAMQEKLATTHVTKNADGKHTKRGFLGVHLRTEADVWAAADFAPYSEQASFYLDFARRSRYPLIYVASGATPDNHNHNITAFSERAADLNLTVVTKKDLLDPEELRHLGSLSWDQQALVDFELMLRSDLMAGTAQSSFAWTIALRRAAAMGFVGGRTTTVLPATAYVRFRDNMSTIMGKEENAKTNMQFSIWP